jgi:hypothetical protein
MAPLHCPLEFLARDIPHPAANHRWSSRDDHMNIRLLIWLAVSFVFGGLGWTGFIFCLGRLTVNFQDNSSPGGETAALALASSLVLFVSTASVLALCVVWLVKALRNGVPRQAPRID